ncbi:Dabb family protein [Actinotalea fermentans]|uniref:Stress protein n=1 Tax=Actinotalea fermentans TaxID=43671 RepID=A0A511Z0U2_9CELL|nr:Dabb family protein [Actinotalea fermentans]GEN81074.1 stress protein [Actinotalea fermentans]
MSAQIIHVVLVRWAATAAPDVVARFDAAARVVRETIPGVLEVAHGPSVSVENLEQGYDYALHVRFADAAARDAYLPHPSHVPLAELIVANAETFVVFDLAVGDAS